MPRYIIKLDDGRGGAFYMEWSTIVDAPVTFGMRLDEFTEHYREQYGLSGADDLPDRMRRVEERGTSCHHDTSAQDTVRFNRAGRQETCLTIAQIAQHYGWGRDRAGSGQAYWDNLPLGHRHSDDELRLCEEIPPVSEGESE